MSLFEDAMDVAGRAGWGCRFSAPDDARRLGLLSSEAWGRAGAQEGRVTLIC
jgi:hypothetical protein